MAGTIKGLTIDIGADTKKFQSEIKKVDKDINNTNKQVDALSKALQLEFDAGRFSQAQKLAQDALEKTDAKAQALRQRLDYLDKVGTDKSSEEYKKLQTQLIKTESDAVVLKEKLEKINELKLNKALSEIEDVGKGVETIGKAITPFSAAAAGALAGLTAISQGAISSAATLDDMSQQINLSAEELQRWQYIAMQTGLDNSTLQTSFVKVQDALGALATGETSTVTEVLQNLGITAEEASQGMSANFDEIIRALSAIEDPMVQAAYANELFGTKMGSKLIPILNAGGEAIEKLTAEFESLGYLTNEQVSSFAEFDDTLNVLKYSFSMIGKEIAASLLPIMKELTGIVSGKILPAVQQLSDWFINLDTSQQKLILGITAFVAVLGPALLVFGKVLQSVQSIKTAISSLQGALNVLASHPIILVITAVVALLVLLYQKNEDFRNSVNNLFETLSKSLQPILEILLDTLEEVFNALMPLIDAIIDVLAPILTTIVNIITPIINMLVNTFVPVLQMLTNLITPIATLVTNVLAPAFEFLGNIITSVFSGIPNIINRVLKFLEDVVNGVIDFINGLIRGVNSLGKYIGLTLSELDRVSFTLETVTPSTPEANITAPSQAEEVITETPSTNTNITNNNDYSDKEITINVTVENYGEEVDVDNLIEQINIKLAEQM